MHELVATQDQAGKVGAGAEGPARVVEDREARRDAPLLTQSTDGLALSF
jgi:hypothetical protein